MDLRLAYASVGTAYSYVLVASSEASHGMALEMCQDQERIIVEKTLSYVHLLEPLAALYGEGRYALSVGDVHGAEGPAVDLQGLTVIFSRITAPRIISVGLYYVPREGGSL